MIQDIEVASLFEFESSLQQELINQRHQLKCLLQQHQEFICCEQRPVYRRLIALTTVQPYRYLESDDTMQQTQTLKQQFEEYYNKIDVEVAKLQELLRIDIYRNKPTPDHLYYMQWLKLRQIIFDKFDAISKVSQSVDFSSLFAAFGIIQGTTNQLSDQCKRISSLLEHKNDSNGIFSKLDCILLQQDKIVKKAYDNADQIFESIQTRLSSLTEVISTCKFHVIYLQDYQFRYERRLQRAMRTYE